MSETISAARLTAGFEYIGPPRAREARAFNLPIASNRRKGRKTLHAGANGASDAG